MYLSNDLSTKKYKDGKKKKFGLKNHHNTAQKIPKLGRNLSNLATLNILQHENSDYIYMITTVEALETELNCVCGKMVYNLRWPLKS